MRMCSIASGSSGNCIYVGSDTTHLLVDVGLSGKRTEAGLAELDLKMQDVDGILITHEHADHIAGLGVLARKYNKTIYCTKGTKEAILREAKVGALDADLFQVVLPDEKTIIKDMVVTPIRTSHDAAEPCAYKFAHGNEKCAVMTDLGYYNDYIVEQLKGIGAIVLEANHDINMLQVGPYPYYLKQRILGEKGHLSNEASGQLLCQILHDNMQHIVLGHLSKDNNIPELAYETVRMEVTMSDLPYKGNDFPIYVAKRSEVSDILHIHA